MYYGDISQLIFVEVIPGNDFLMEEEYEPKPNSFYENAPVVDRNYNPGV